MFHAKYAVAAASLRHVLARVPVVFAMTTCKTQGREGQGVTNCSKYKSWCFIMMTICGTGLKARERLQCAAPTLPDDMRLLDSEGAAPASTCALLVVGESPTIVFQLADRIPASPPMSCDTRRVVVTQSSGQQQGASATTIC